MASDAELEQLVDALAGRSTPSHGLCARMGQLAEQMLRPPRNPDAVARARALARTAAAALDATDPLYPKLQHVEATALRCGPAPDEATLQQAAALERAAWQRSLEIAPREAIGFAGEWGDWAWQEQRWDEAAEAYAGAHRGLRRFLLRQVTSDRERLNEFSFTRYAARGAYAYARIGNGREALVLLERVNDPVFGLHQQRWDITRLQQTQPAAWGRLESALAAKRLFDVAAKRGFGLDSYGNLPPAARAAQAAEDDAVAAVRKLDGFASFALPSGWNDIAAAAAVAPIVTLVPTDKGCALFLVARQQDGTTGTWLAFLPETERDIYTAAKPFIDAEFGTAGGDRRAALASLVEWLGLHIMRVVRQALERQGLADRAFTLAPFGILGILPLHAGCVWLEAPHRLHYFFHPRDVSFSYSARGLTQSRRRQAGAAPGPSLVVSNPLPLRPSFDPLQLSEFEAAEVIRHCPGSVLQGREATTAQVCAALPQASFVHFSCHGSVDRRISYSGILLLANSEELTFEHLRAMPEIQARLVVLSACRSGSAAVSVEQMVSLPAAFLAAGAAAVLGTFWHTDETASLLLIGRFYDLFCDGGLAPAAALGEAQAWLMTATACVLRQAMPPAALALAPATVLREAMPDARPYVHPWYWAAFFLAGA